MLVSHFPELHLVSIGRALLDVHFQDFALLLRLEGLAVAAARAALRLHLLYHGAHADDLDLDAAAIASLALLDPPRLVDDLAGDRHFLGGAVVHLLQGDLQRLYHILGFLPPAGAAATPAAATTEHLAEDVAGVPAAALLEALLAEAVVLRTLVGVAQYLVGTADLLEHLRIAALVRMVLHRELPIGLLDVRLRGVLLDLEGLVELGGIRSLGAAPATAAAAAGELAAGHARETAEEHFASGSSAAKAVAGTKIDEFELA
mmetsp:Transcript_172407/g.552665  ORF Transcript_172407/g.552665 Transcript_172407/m.552665 type:complete len:260 (-) Transcript_172407:3-782(-)